MADNLELDRAGKAMMAYSGEVPWHGLGKNARPDLTPEQFLVEAGLNWEVVKCQQYYEYNNEFWNSDDVALVRTSDGKQLSSVSSDWEITQNHEAFSFFNEFVNAGDMEMHTAGSLHGGKLIWGLAKIKESFEIVDRDLIQPYLLFTNPHWYGRCIDIRLTPIRVVCDNTMTMALAGKGDLAVKLHHRQKFNPDFVKDTMGMSRRKLDEYKSMGEYLAGRRYTADNVIEYFKKVFPAVNPEERESMRLSRAGQLAFVAMDHQPGVDFARGSWWQALNAVTFTTNHLVNGKNPAKRLESAWYGLNRDRNSLAMKLALDYADKSRPMALAA